ncbi:MAG: sce7726 family protein [Lachnospiraceae bacterium]|nr:sce7726 family protein [Lachnospiraceae bacterium]
MEKCSEVLKDRDIREPLFEFLEETYGKIRILEEKTMGRSRADLVMVAPECLYGIEIKSDADTYARLKRQVKDYDQYYDYNIVVVGSTHAMHIEEHVPDYWGIVTVEQMNGNADFYFLRLPKENPKRKWERKMQILWRPELATIQEWNTMPKYKEKSKRFVVDKILERVPEKIPEEMLSRQISDILFERDYNTIAETLAEYRKAERKKKGAASCRYRKRKRI